MAPEAAEEEIVVEAPVEEEMTVNGVEEEIATESPVEEEVPTNGVEEDQNENEEAMEGKVLEIYLAPEEVAAIDDSGVAEETIEAVEAIDGEAAAVEEEIAVDGTEIDQVEAETAEATEEENGQVEEESSNPVEEESAV